MLDTLICWTLGPLLRVALAIPPVRRFVAGAAFGYDWRHALD